MAMLLTMHHLCLKCSRFAFNCYSHKAKLIVQNLGYLPLILWSREDFTQGDLMAMVLYGIVLVPLVKILWHAFLEFMQPLYADYSALMGQHTTNTQCLKLSKWVGPLFRYFSEPEKSWHIWHAEDEDAAREAFAKEGLTVWFSQSNCNMGRFIGLVTVMREWLAPIVLDLVFGIKQLVTVTVNYPQTAYTGMVVSLQAKWQYVCCIVLNMTLAMVPVDSHAGELSPCTFWRTHSYCHWQWLRLPPHAKLMSGDREIQIKTACKSGA